MTNRTTDKTIVISVLGYINDHSGYVSITRHLQTNFQLDSSGLNRILTALTRNGLVTKDMNDKWSVAITDPKGLSVLHKPALLNDNGDFISNKSFVQIFKEEHPNIFGFVMFILGGIATLLMGYWFNKTFGDGKEKTDPVEKPQINDSPKTTDTTNLTSRENGERKYYDSAHFSVIRGWYVSGAKFIDCLEDKKTNLDTWKEYYENGQLKKEGVMTNANHIYVGTWNYYSPSSKIDSTINYDDKYPISYFEAIEIAKKAGHKVFGGFDVSLDVEDKTISWEIMLERKDKSDTRDVLLINTQTGEKKIDKDRILISH